MQHRADLVQQVVTTEDYWMTASIQAGIASGAQETVVFGRNRTRSITTTAPCWTRSSTTPRARPG